MLDLLHRVPYFAGLPDNLLAELARVAVERRYSRGEIIFLEGEPCSGLYVVARGEVKIFKVSPQGREQILHQIGPGGTFNDVAALDGEPNPASAAAIADTTLHCITRADLRRLAHAYPALAWVLIESIARRARHLVGIVEDLSLRSVKARLAKLLLAEAERAAAQPELDRTQMVTQAEMAARLGTVREMVGRGLRELAEEGLIVMDRHRIVIADREKLEAVAEGT
jgi:CRP/FNR family transcriptional regulator